MQDKTTGAYRAIKAIGGPKVVAEKLGIKGKRATSTVHNWTEYGRKVPAEHVIALCRLSHYLFQPYEIRPDLYREDQVLEPGA